MPRMSGGMEFEQGRLMRWSAPPATLPAGPIHLVIPGNVSLEVGQRVRRGELLWEPSREDCACIDSPVSGVIGAIHRGQGGDELAIEPREEAVPTAISTDPPRGRTLDAWFAALRRHGPWCDGEPAFDLLAQMQLVREKQPAMLICVGLDAFPPYPDRSSLLMSFPDDAVLGTQVLADILGVKRVLMLAPMRRGVIGRLRRSCRNFRVPLSAVHNVYPSAHPTLVAWSHARRRRRLPPGVLPAQRGIVMISPWTAIRLARWFTRRELDLAHPVMIGWPQRAAGTTCAWALPGQALHSIHERLGDSSHHVVAGHPMTGKPLAVRTVAMDRLLLSVVSSVEPPRAESCISCGWCAEVCPTDLRPIHLAQQIQSREKVRPRDAKAIEWCIDCGLCSHVCPSQIPIAQTIRAYQEQNAPST